MTTLWFPCCGDQERPCVVCTDDADTMTVTLAGIADFMCDCDWLNATFILRRKSPEQWWGDVCSWEVAGEFECSYGATGLYALMLRAQLFAVGFDTIAGWYFSVNVWGPMGMAQSVAIYRWWGAPGEDTFDCTATRLINLVSVGGMPGTCRNDSWPATVQVN